MCNCMLRLNISVIIPTYQHADTIERCLRSVLSQSLQPKEIIIVYDGSTDETEKILTSFVRTTPTLSVFRQANHGSNSARNKGFEHSSGSRVIFLDADAVMRPDMLEKLSKAIDEHPRAGFAYSAFRFGWKRFRSFPFDVGRLRRMNYIHTSALIRREAFPGFDESVKRFQDWDLWLSMLERGYEGAFVSDELFRVVQVRGRRGISSWRPSVFYQLPWFGKKPESIRAYEAAREIILKKHELWM